MITQENKRVDKTRLRKHKKVNTCASLHKSVKLSTRLHKHRNKQLVSDSSSPWLFHTTQVRDSSTLHNAPWSWKQYASIHHQKHPSWRRTTPTLAKTITQQVHKTTRNNLYTNKKIKHIYLILETSRWNNQRLKQEHKPFYIITNQDIET